MAIFDQRPIGDHEPPSKKKKVIKKALRLFPHNKDDFRTRKISVLFATAIVFLAAFFVYKIVSTAVFYAGNFSPSDIFFIFAGNVTQDEMHRTNILLVGTGGGDHDAPDLTDSIIVASYNHITKTASMLSIPRDLYVKIPGYGSSRINKIYENLKPDYGSPKSLEILSDTAEIVAGIDIHYYLKVDFAAFRDTVDVLGGVDIDVKRAIYDESYPDDNYGFEIFQVDKGPHHFDGETALKYARSRHTTSDFDRAQRQQQLLVAIKEKAMGKKILTSPMKLKKLWAAFSEHVETNMSFAEMAAFARIAKSFDTSQIVSKVLRDIEMAQEGAFLYTPEREFYGGAFVLRPWGETYKDVHKYTDIIFGTPEVYLENARIEIQNGSGVSGAASNLMDYLITYGFNVVRINNTPDKEEYAKTHYSTIEHEGSPWTMQKLGELLPRGKKIDVPKTRPGSDVDIVIVIGEDFPNDYHEVDYYVE
jgi:LCP family protein required for cell wall assembly